MMPVYRSLVRVIAMPAVLLAFAGCASTTPEATSPTADRRCEQRRAFTSACGQPLEHTDLSVSSEPDAIPPARWRGERAAAVAVTAPSLARHDASFAPPRARPLAPPR